MKRLIWVVMLCAGSATMALAQNTAPNTPNTNQSTTTSPGSTPNTYDSRGNQNTMQQRSGAPGTYNQGNTGTGNTNTGTTNPGGYSQSQPGNSQYGNQQTSPGGYNQSQPGNSQYGNQQTSPGMAPGNTGRMSSDAGYRANENDYRYVPENRQGQPQGSINQNQSGTNNAYGTYESEYSQPAQGNMGAGSTNPNTQGSMNNNNSNMGGNANQGTNVNVPASGDTKVKVKTDGDAATGTDTKVKVKSDADKVDTRTGTRDTYKKTKKVVRRDAEPDKVKHKVKVKDE